MKIFIAYFVFYGHVVIIAENENDARTILAEQEYGDAYTLDEKEMTRGVVSVIHE